MKTTEVSFGRFLQIISQTDNIAAKMIKPKIDPMRRVREEIVRLTGLVKKRVKGDPGDAMSAEVKRLSAVDALAMLTFLESKRETYSRIMRRPPTEGTETQLYQRLKARCKKKQKSAVK